MTQPRQPFGGARQTDRRLTSSARRKLTARMRADDNAWICHLCGLPIDRDAPRNSPGEWTADEIVPRSWGGNPLDPSNLLSSHRACNSKRQDKPVRIARQEARARVAARRPTDDTPPPQRTPECLAEREAAIARMREQDPCAPHSRDWGYADDHRIIVCAEWYGVLDAIDEAHGYTAPIIAGRRW